MAVIEIDVGDMDESDVKELVDELDEFLTDDLSIDATVTAKKTD